MVLAAIVATAALAVAAPALSLQPYVPEPVEFELAPPGAGAATVSAAGGTISRELRAPKRFNLVGLRWRGGGEPGIAIRTRRAGGPWSRWTTVPVQSEDAPDSVTGEPHPQGTSNPVWAGQADYVQYRSSRRLPGLRLHFVNTTGTATAVDRARTALRRAVSRGAVALASVTNAQAAGAKPSIRSRASWGARHCPPRRRPARGSVKAALVHHTVTTNGYGRSDVPSMILGICRYHRNSNGWDDIGYNFLLDRYGVIWEGRAGGVGSAVVGAQAQGFNAQTTGIANLGTHTGVRQRAVALNAIARLVRWKLPHHGQPTSGRATVVSAGGPLSRYPRGARVSLSRVSGHRDVGRTECPGSALYRQLPDLRRRVGSSRPAPASPSVRASVSAQAIDYGQSVAVKGSARGRDGRPLRGAPIDIERRDGRTWHALARTQSNDAGAFSADVILSRNSRLRARYPGRRSVPPASSAVHFVGVRAVLTANVTAPESGGRSVISGTIRPGKPRVEVVVQRRARGTYRVIATLPTTGSDGSFRVTYRFRRPGRYRVRARFTGDARHLAGISARIPVQVAAGDEYAPAPQA